MKCVFFCQLVIDLSFPPDLDRSLLLLDLSPVSVLGRTNAFPLSVSCLFILSVVSSDERMFLILTNS